MMYAMPSQFFIALFSIIWYFMMYADAIGWLICLYHEIKIIIFITYQKVDNRLKKIILKKSITWRLYLILSSVSWILSNKIFTTVIKENTKTVYIAIYHIFFILSYIKKWSNMLHCIRTCITRNGIMKYLIFKKRWTINFSVKSSITVLR